MECYGQRNAEVLELSRCHLGSPLIPHDLALDRSRGSVAKRRRPTACTARPSKNIYGLKYSSCMSAFGKMSYRVRIIVKIAQMYTVSVYCTNTVNYRNNNDDVRRDQEKYGTSCKNTVDAS